jgi:hypothetical protein
MYLDGARERKADKSGEGKPKRNYLIAAVPCIPSNPSEKSTADYWEPEDRKIDRLHLICSYLVVPASLGFMLELQNSRFSE